MKRILSVIFLVLIAGNVAYAGDKHRHSKESDYYLSNPEQLYKSESFGRNLALFPGILVHGLGHMYSGHGGEGALLFLSELVGLVMVFGDNFSTPGFYYAPPPEDWPIDFSGGYSEQKTGILTFIGAGIFLGSWIYDCVRTPVLIRKYNQKIDRKYQTLSFGIKPDLRRKSVMFSLSFNF